MTRSSRTPTQPPIVCPTLHVERLYDDRAWTVLRRCLERLAKHGGHATAFVSTRRAREAERDLRDRLQWLVDNGHEVAMHTHFRRSDRPAEGASDENMHAPPSDHDIVMSLEGDYTYLVDRGHPPRGFCAGTWSIYPAATQWLRTQGFHYDCSFRSYELGYDNPSATPGDSHAGPSVVNGVLQIPTTASLRAMTRNLLRRRYPSVPYDGGAYALYYLHDWDLLDRRKEVAWHFLARRLHSATVVPVQEIARAIGGVGA